METSTMVTNTARIGVTITKAQRDFIKSQVRAGNFQNESDVLRDLLREKMDEKRIVHLEYLKKRIADSEASGISDATPKQREARINKIIKSASARK